MQRTKTKSRDESILPLPLAKSYDAPQDFSIFESTEPMLNYFGDIVKYFKSSKASITSVHINIQSVTRVTIDSIIYLLAIMRHAEQGKSLIIGGNFPANSLITQHIVDSGFLKHVDLRIPLAHKASSDCFQITTGTLVEARLAGLVCDYCYQKLGITTKDCKFLLPMLNELMKNTLHHAYEKKGALVNIKEWYLFVENASDCLKFTFLDTGNGIPSTVSKQVKEHIIDALTASKDSEYLHSVFRGDFRSAIKKPGRGNGLPEIYSRCKEGAIQNLKVISGKGFFGYNGNNDIVTELACAPLEGTLFYWEVSKAQYRKVI